MKSGEIIFSSFRFIVIIEYFRDYGIRVNKSINGPKQDPEINTHT